MESKYLKYLSENINNISVDKRDNLQKKVEDYLNDVISFEDLSLSAYDNGLEDFLFFKKRMAVDSILDD